MLRFFTAGESHGPGLVTIVDGVPAGLALSTEAFNIELARRRHGYGRGQRMQIEKDQVEILGGVRHGRTLGSPVAVVVHNTEWDKWSEVMGVEKADPGRKMTRPRPGHADLPGMLKFDTDDVRDVLERASARETAARTIAGVVARAILKECGVAVLSHVLSIGSVEAQSVQPGPDDRELIDADPVRCLDPEASSQMMAAIDQAKLDKDTLGGRFEVAAFGVVPGVGSYTQYDRRLDADLAAAMISIPAVKAVEIGDGWDVASRLGSKAHDEIYHDQDGLQRRSNHAGGVEGGMSNGSPILVRAAMKPIATLMQPLETVDMSSGEPAQAVRERADVCAVPAAAVVGEQMVCWVLAEAMHAKFGGDTMPDMVSALDSYRRRIADRP